MTRNNPLLFRFVRGMVQAFRGITVYAFHTRLFPVTEFFRAPTLEKIQHRLEKNNRLWMRGTRIGSSLEHFNQHYMRLHQSPRPLVLILSDGLDPEDDQLLYRQLV